MGDNNGYHATETEAAVDRQEANIYTCDEAINLADVGFPDPTRSTPTPPSLVATTPRVYIKNAGARSLREVLSGASHTRPSETQGGGGERSEPATSVVELRPSMEKRHSGLTAELLAGAHPESNLSIGSTTQTISTGRYTGGLLAGLTLALLSMAVDMFGFSVVVAGASCHFRLDHTQKSLLISTPFIGPIVTSYMWGYLSDTRGRRRALLGGLWGGSVAAAAGAFSTHWVALGALKIIGTSLSSSAQSATFTYLGESVPERVRGPYGLVMTSGLMLFLLAYDVPAYFILNLSFSYDWGFITFTPWRLLALVLAAPLAASALMLHFFCESPKFLVSVGKENLALEHLRTMWRRNGNAGVYPVTKIVLNEESRLRRKEESLLSAVLEQAWPLFRPPLLRRTLQLFYLTTVIYSINNGLVMWMPVVAEAFAAGLRAGTGAPRGSASLCDIIVGHHANSTGTNDIVTCISSIDVRTLASGVAHGLIFSSVTLLISWFSRRKLLMMTFLCLPLVCSLLAVYNESSVLSMVLYVGMISTNFCMGILFGYYVNLYPTSYRGMAACLGVMVSRASGLGAVHFLGALLMTHCRLTFLAFAAFLLSGVVVAYFLPPDKTIKE